MKALTLLAIIATFTSLGTARAELPNFSEKRIRFELSKDARLENLLRFEKSQGATCSLELSLTDLQKNDYQKFNATYVCASVDSSGEDSDAIIELQDAFISFSPIQKINSVVVGGYLIHFAD